MLRFIKRSTTNSQKPEVVFTATSTASFSDVCTYAVHRSNKLLPDCIHRQVIPLVHYRPDSVGHILGQTINFKPFKVRLHSLLLAPRRTFFPPTKDQSPKTQD